MSKNELNKLKLSEHFSIFAYPFLHDVKGNQKNTRLSKLSSKWQNWWSRIETDNDIASTLDSTYFFLPYIRKLIFPETALLTFPSGKNYSDWINQIKILRQKSLTELSNVLPTNSILRMTLNEDSLLQYQEFIFDRETESEIVAKMCWVDVILFPSGVGFLVFKIKLMENSESIENLIELNKSFRSVHPFNINQNLPKFKFKSIKNKQFLVQDLIENLLEGFVSNEEKYTESEAGQIYGERCHLLSFAGLDLNEVNLQNVKCGNFNSVENLLLYEFATCTNLYDSMIKSHWKPSASQVESIKNENLISSWDCWSGLVLRDSVVFLAKDQNEFNKYALPHIIEEDYLPLYFYSLYQKYQLYLFSDRLMQKGADISENLKEVRSLTNHVFTFRNRYWFNEITRKQLGNEIYRKFKHGLGIFEAYDLVNEEITDLKEFYEEKNNRKIQDALTVLTFLFVPFGAIISYWGMNHVENGNWMSFIISSVLGIILPYSIYNIWNRLKI